VEKIGEEDLVKKTVVRKTLLQCFWTSRRRRRRRRSSGPCEETGRTNLFFFLPQELQKLIGIHSTSSEFRTLKFIQQNL
jgi:hypothetical protein